MNASQGTSLEPHHLTVVRYPCIELISKSKGFTAQQLHLLPVQDAKSRYEPKPLIDDPAIIRNTLHALNIHDAFHSITNVITYEGNSRTLQRKLGVHADFNALVRDMNAAESKAGKTYLLAFTYVQGVAEIRVRVRRETKFRRADGNPTCRAASYEFPLAVLEGIKEDDDSRTLWIPNLKDLIWRRTDLAVLHVQQSLRSYFPTDFKRDKPEWKWPRGPNYSKLLERMEISSEMNTSGEMVCAVCREVLFDSAGPAVVRLPCSDKHVCHKDCWEELMRFDFEALPARSVRCLFCRSSVLLPEDVEFLKYGTAGLAYVEDPRFDQFENFRRACQDLDSKRAIQSIERVTVSKPLLERIYELLLAGARTESNISTAAHLQIATCEEIDLLGRAITTVSETLHGKTVKAKVLHAAIMNDLRGHIAFALSNADDDTIPTSAQLASWEAILGKFAESQIRPGFIRYCSNLVSQVIVAARIRNCNCVKDELTHYHGLRSFMNFEHPDWLGDRIADFPAQ